MEGRAPTAKAVSKMSPFSILFLKKAEKFCVYSTVAPSDDGKSAPRKVVLTGYDALNARFEKFVGGHSDPSSADLKEFRSYRWMLNEQQNTQVNEWQSAAVLSAKDKIQAEKKKAIADIQNAVAIPREPQPVTLEMSLVPPIVSKKKKNQPRVDEGADKALEAKKQKCIDEEVEEEEDASSTGLISFFGSKAL